MDFKHFEFIASYSSLTEVREFLLKAMASTKFSFDKLSSVDNLVFSNIQTSYCGIFTGRGRSVLHKCVLVLQGNQMAIGINNRLIL